MLSLPTNEERHIQRYQQAMLSQRHYAAAATLRAVTLRHDAVTRYAVAADAAAIDTPARLLITRRRRFFCIQRAVCYGCLARHAARRHDASATLISRIRIYAKE